MKPHDWIGELLSTYRTKPLILVEGEDDSALYAQLLKVVDPDWQNRFELEWVSGKRRVFQGCQKVPAWRGLVDCDEWAEAQVTAAQTETPNVQILPRFTAQNYWINPDELRYLIPAATRTAHPGAGAQLAAEIETQRADWTAHGAMWRVMLRRQIGLGDLRFPQELMNEPVTDEAQILTILTRWHNHFEPHDVLNEYRVERDAALARSPNEQYAHVIHGKRFFRQVVTLVLNRVFHSPGKTANEWMADLTASMMTVPVDLRPALEALLA
jgi:hypothetical protein